MKYNKEKKKKLQQGGIIQRKNILEQILGIRPKNTTPLNNQEYGYSYKRPLGESVYTEIVKNIPYGNGELVSQRKITNPGTVKADTIYTMPSGQRVTDPTDLNRYKNKFGQLDSLTQSKQEGGTLDPKKVMEEARRNQLIERQAQARDAVKTSGIAAYQSTPVTIQSPRQEVILKEYASSKPISFSQAFGEARKAGLTDLKDTSQTTKTNTPVVNTSAANTPVVNTPVVSSTTVNVPLSEEQLGINEIIRKYGTEGLERIRNTTYDGGVLPELTVAAKRLTPKNNNTPKVRTTSILHRLKNWPGYSIGLVSPQKMYGYQQGGKVSNSDASQQLYVDFAVRYLKAKGVSEEDMVDESGSLNDEYIQEVTSVIGEIDTPEFWEAYKQDPDGTVNMYIKSSSDPEEIELAKKGAKLKQLKNKKMRKCKCGCNLTLKKEAGGTIVEVCACGCKNK